VAIIFDGFFYVDDSYGYNCLFFSHWLLCKKRKASQRGSEILTGLNREQLQKDVMEVVQRHLNDVQARSPQFQVRQDGDVSMFEMQVEIVPRKR